jgi:HAE1 family hydrophobic/amphiphilic exporter-1
VVVDDGDYINQIITGLKEHLLEGTILAALVVLLFLKNIRSTLIVATAIPVSLLGAVAAIYFAGFTFNTMTLLGLLLLIGVVVDDAIVVLENIFRLMEDSPNEEPEAISVLGTNQVMFSILAATLTLVSLFGAVVFMDGIMGRFLGAFAVVVVFGVLISLFVSITLTPVLCARYLRVDKQHGKVYHWLENSFRAMERYYRRSLETTLQHRFRVLVIAALIVLSSGWFMGQLGKGFMPDEDQSRFIVSIKTPLGSSIEYTRNRLILTEKVLSSNPEVSGLFSTIGSGSRGRVNKGEIYVTLTPRNERDLHQVEVIQKIRKQLAQIPGVKAFAAPVPIIGGQRGEPLQFVLTGPDLNKVAEFSNILEHRLRKNPVIGPLDTNLQLDMPEIRILPDREQARKTGVDTITLSNALRVLAGGFDVAKFNDEPGDGFRYKIRLKAAPGSFKKTQDLNSIYLRNNLGEMVRLDSIVKFENLLGPATIGKYNLQYSATFYSTPTIPEGDASQIVLKEAAKILPSGYAVELIGRAKEFEKTTGYIIFAFVTGLVLVYMTLASQFNSFIQPLIVMVAQPLAIIGGIFSLWISNHTLNIYSMIGLVLLVGLVAKNSILLIDLTNQLRAEGKSIKEALLQACPQRMRPVLMTSLTVILSLLPAALGFGAGSDTNAPMAVAVIGGMVSSTLLTLVVVPAVYSLVERFIEKRKEMGSQKLLNEIFNRLKNRLQLSN